MRRHLRWLIPLILIPLTYLAGCLVLNTLDDVPTQGPNVGLALTELSVAGLTVLLPLIGTVFAVVGGVSAIRSWRRSRGHFSRVERAANAAADQADIAWQQARHLRATLIERKIPEAITVWDVVPRPGESMFFDLRASYARHYGQDVTYTQRSGFFFGHPAFVLTGIAATQIGNSARRNAAEVAAQATWREWQECRVVVTNQRIICQAGGRWLTFDYDAMVAVYPEVEKWTLICNFGDRSEPLLLSGLSAPTIAVMTLLVTHGVEAVRSHPSLQQLGS